jgi:hypothetical protein
VSSKNAPTPLLRNVERLDAVEAAEVARALVDGAELSDVRFDRVYPTALRRVSSLHFTELHVVRKALELLDPRKGDMVLDVGSGAGKFCLAGALITEAHFLGLEQRPALVEAANSAASLLGAARAAFSVRDALEYDWSLFPMLYLFNPFEENVMPIGHRIDDGPPHSRERHLESVRAAQAKLEHMPRGTKVVTFHGLGGAMPDNYELMHQTLIVMHQTLIGDGPLELWICRRASRRAL